MLSVPRAIQTPEELLLLVKIYESQGRHAEIAKLMDSENVGVNSRVVQNDMSFIGVKLDNLQKASMWAEALSYAKTLLSIPKDEAGQKVLDERDDWAVWDKIVVATRNINDSG